MQKTVPLYWGLPEDPDRRLIGEAVVDTDTGKVMSTITNSADAPPFPIGTTVVASLDDLVPHGYVVAKGAKISSNEPTQ